MKKILVLLCHPDLETSQINKAIAELLNKHTNVTLVDLYKAYPKFEIDIKAEQKRLMSHDVVVFLFPFFWYSTPPLLKKWQDDVLEYGFAYGSSGNKLQGKEFINIISTGSNYERYNNEQHTIDDFIKPINATITDTGMKIQEPLVLYSSRTAIDEQRLARHLNKIEQRLLDIR